MIALPYARMIGIGVALAAAAALIVMVTGWKHERDRLRDWQGEVAAATREAAGNPQLAAKDTAAQIRLLGTAIGGLKAALATQNAAVAALGRESARQRQIAMEARERAVERAGAAEAVAQRLTASSRLAARQAAPCAPSDELKRAWP